MYTGIVQAVLTIEAIEKQPDFQSIHVRFPEHLLLGVTLGASIAFNGVCLTVSAIDGALLSFDIMQETLKETNLSDLEVGSLVNVERSAKFGDEVGGHPISGHIVGMAVITDVTTSQNNLSLRMRAPEGVDKYLFNKGFIALNGASLTLSQVEGSEFSVHLIPETLRQTTFSDAAVGNLVNLEVDNQTQVIVETVERLMAQKSV